MAAVNRLECITIIRMTTKSDKSSLGSTHLRRVVPPLRSQPRARGFARRYRFWLKRLLRQLLIGGMALDQRLVDLLVAAGLLLLLSPLLVVLLLTRQLSGDTCVGRYGVPFTLWRLRGGSRLPALWNVLRGELTLYGPPPLRPDEADPYSLAIRRRLTLRPGLLKIVLP